MRRWALFLAGPLVWAAHFLALYALASVSVVIAQRVTLEAKLAMAAFTLAALATLALAAWGIARGPRDDGLPAFQRSVAHVGVILGAIAVVWQMLPAFAL